MTNDNDNHNTDDGSYYYTDYRLSNDQVRIFQDDGVLVVDNVLSEDQVGEAMAGLEETLASCAGIRTNDLSRTGRGLTTLSSTAGSGGVLDVFYPEWKLRVATCPKLFDITRQLWKATFYKYNEQRRRMPASPGDTTTTASPTEQEEQDSDDSKEHNSGQRHILWRQPFGPFDYRKGFMYIDRIGFRLPTTMAEQLGRELQPERQQQQVSHNTPHIEKKPKPSKRKKKNTSIQRCLTPHLDCCPDTFNDHEQKSKWRPIQCFVSLTDTLQAERGGFEAATGFHRNFDEWVKNRPPTVVVVRGGGGQNNNKNTKSIPAPCVGEYTHIRPREDRDVLERVRHVPVRAGSAVFWDTRIPHGNSYRHGGSEPRCVVYCSFLPDVPINRRYAQRQLDNWRKRRQPTDQWINTNNHNGQENDGGENSVEAIESPDQLLERFPPLARRLAGIDPW